MTDQHISIATKRSQVGGFGLGNDTFAKVCIELTQFLLKFVHFWANELLSPVYCGVILCMPLVLMLSAHYTGCQCHWTLWRHVRVHSKLWTGTILLVQWPGTMTLLVQWPMDGVCLPAWKGEYFVQLQLFSQQFWAYALTFLFFCQPTRKFTCALTDL